MDFLQSTARRVVLKAYLASDHITAATGKTIAIQISKNGGAFADPNAGATNATAISNGWYYVDLDTTDTGTLGPLIVRGTEATIDDVEVYGQVVLAVPAVNTTQLNGTAQTAKDLGAINVTNLNTLSGHDPGATIGTSTLDAAGVRTAVGLGSANLDTQLSDISTDATAIKAVTDTLRVKKNTAVSNFTFTMVNAAGTPTAGVTLAATRRLDGGAFGACTNAASSVGNGVYSINLAAADLNGDVVTLRFTGSGVRDRVITLLTHS